MKRVKMILDKVMDPAPRLNRTTLGKLNLILQIFEVCAQYLTYPGQTADYENLIFFKSSVGPITLQQSPRQSAASSASGGGDRVKLASAGVLRSADAFPSSNQGLLVHTIHHPNACL